jgi:hypothetical protein
VGNVSSTADNQVFLVGSTSVLNPTLVVTIDSRYLFSPKQLLVLVFS